MKTTTRWVMLATLIGVALAPPTFLAMRQVQECPAAGSRLFACCKKSACCARCCWLPRGCDDCRPALSAIGAP